MSDILCIVPQFSYGKLDSVGPKCPNLGIGILAAVIEREGYEVKILDCFGHELQEKQIYEEIEKEKPNIVMIGAVTANFTITMNILKKVKELFPKVVTIIGGPHVTVNPNSAFEQEGVDFVVRGEAEETIPELLDLIKNKNEEE
jgi:radical SAM superfamily enzyme YgiQ (UPF0313 family)